MNLYHLLLLAQQSANGGGKAQQDGWQQMLMCVLLVAGAGLIWYFVFIRPKQKEKEERSEMLEALEKNDEIVTIGGLKGFITNVGEDELSVRIDEDQDVVVNCKRWAIRDNLTKQNDEEEEEENS